MGPRTPGGAVAGAARLAPRARPSRAAPAPRGTLGPPGLIRGLPVLASRPRRSSGRGPSGCGGAPLRVRLSGGFVPQCGLRPAPAPPTPQASSEGALSAQSQASVEPTALAPLVWVTWHSSSSYLMKVIYGSEIVRKAPTAATYLPDFAPGTRPVCRRDRTACKLSACTGRRRASSRPRLGQLKARGGCASGTATHRGFSRRFQKPDPLNKSVLSAQYAITLLSLIQCLHVLILNNKEAMQDTQSLNKRLRTCSVPDWTLEILAKCKQEGETIPMVRVHCIV